MFAAFIVAPEHHKHSYPAFSPGGDELFFSAYPNYEFPQKIYIMERVDGRWTPPRVAPFSGKYQEGGPFFSPDGSKLFFYSKRPLDGAGEEKSDADVWYVERTAGGWSEPINAGAPLNSAGGEYPWFLSSDGTLFLRAPAESNNADIFRSLLRDGGFSPPENIGPPVNTPHSIEGGVCVDSEGRFFVFMSYRRDGRNAAALYFRFKRDDGTWSPVRKMGDMINTGGARFPGVSPDGKYLFFTSYRSGQEEFYWVDATVIDYLKSEDLNLIDAVYRTVLDDGLEAAKRQYDELSREHAGYYVFTERFFFDVADKLLAADSLHAAANVMRYNLELHPDSKSTILMLKLALIEDDRAGVDEFSGQLRGDVSPDDRGVETEINRLGYVFLRMAKHNIAIEVFVLNAELFPESANAYDSLGEAYMASGDEELAAANYRKSLELNPANRNAEEMLKRLDAADR
jgi:tetratricopeptide (TPR) repeat protein